MNDEAKLLRSLLHNYDPNVRPLVNSSSAITVKFGGTLLSFDMDEEKNTLDAVVWLNFEWTNEFFKWDPASYGHLEDIRIPADLMWVPDIMLYNDAFGGFNKYLNVGNRPTLTVVNNKGDVTWIPPNRASVSCRFDDAVKNYLCSLKFGSWVHSGLGIDLQLNSNDGLDLSSLVVNKNWDLVSSEGKLNSVKYDCCPETYLDITFKLVIKKKPACLTGLFC